MNFLSYLKLERCVCFKMFLIPSKFIILDMHYLLGFLYFAIINDNKLIN